MRSTRNQPFCWQEKKILRLLQNNFKKTELVKFKMLYVTITEIDSDFNSKVIKFYTKTIAKYSGLSLEWIPKGLKKLEEFGILKILEEKIGGRFKGKQLIFTPENIQEIPLKTVIGKTGNGKTVNGKSVTGKTDTSEDSNLLEDSHCKENSINTNKGTPEINSGDSFNKSIHPENLNKENKCPENLNRINKTIFNTVKEVFSIMPFTNVLPDNNAERCNTKTYENIQNFLYNLHECRLKSAYTWKGEWVERNHIDFHALREKAVGTNGSSRIPFEVIKEMLKKSLKNYKLMQKEGYWPEKKETLTLNFKDFLYNFRQQTSWFLYCLFNEPEELKEKTAEKIIADLPEKVRELIINFGEDESLNKENWPKIAYYTKAKELYLWYEPRAKKLCKHHTLVGLDGFRQYMADFHDLIDRIYDFMETWKTPWTVNHFGMNCKTWDLFLKWLYKRYEYRIDLDDEYLDERVKRYDEMYPVKKSVKSC